MLGKILRWIGDGAVALRKAGAKAFRHVPKWPEYG